MMKVILSVHDEGYSRNGSYALNVISMFLFYLFTFIDESLCDRTELSENVV